MRKDHANSVVQPRNPQGWTNVINRCDVVMTAGVHLRNALKGVKLKDPGLRHQKDFWQLCDGLVKVSATTMNTSIRSELTYVNRHGQTLWWPSKISPVNAWS